MFDEGYFTVTEPFAPFIHHWDILMQKANSRHLDDVDGSDEAALGNSISATKLLSKLLDYINEIPVVQRYLVSRERRIAEGYTTFEFLWTFFPPRCLVLVKVLGHNQLMRVEACNPVQGGRQTPLSIFCSIFDWEDHEFRRVVYKMSIPPFSGRRQITDFPCFPLSHIKEHKRLMEQLLHRGRHFWRHCSSPHPSVKEYKGVAWSLEPGNYESQVGQAILL